MLGKIKEVRALTGVSLGRCKKAVEEANGDISTALVLLQKWGESVSRKRAHKDTSAGLIQSYVHHNGKIAVLVEINCETSFAARSDPFREFCENLALQIASAAPDYLSVNDIPEKVMAKQKEIFLAQVPEGAPDNKVDHIVNGKLKKWFGEVCLVDQKSVMVDKKTVGQTRSDLVQKIEENVVIKRFVRWELGEA